MGQPDQPSCGKNASEVVDYGGGEFVGAVEGIVYGVDSDGIPFDTARQNWSDADRIRWGFGNSRLFLDIARKLHAYACAVQKQKHNAERDLAKGLKS